MDKHNLEKEVTKFIVQSVKIWSKGFPNNPSKPQYKFEEMSTLTDGHFKFQCSMTGLIRAFLDGKEVGSVDIVFDAENLEDSDIRIFKNTTHILNYSNKGFPVPTEVIIHIYYILIKLLEDDLIKTKFKFERLEFEGFYDK